MGVHVDAVACCDAASLRTIGFGPRIGGIPDVGQRFVVDRIPRGGHPHLDCAADAKGTANGEARQFVRGGDAHTPAGIHLRITLYEGLRGVVDIK